MKLIQLLSTADLDREGVDFLIKEAEQMRKVGRTSDLAGKIVATLFFEPSTRTRLSFEAAALRLGAQIMTVADASTTSTKKGETMEDTIRVFDKFCDAIVMRQPVAGATAEAAKYTRKPVINGGDGSNQHPSQALLDMLTIYRETGKNDGLTIGFVGDLKFGRTVHSLLELLTHYKDIKLVLISPNQLKMPGKYLELLKEKGVSYVEDTDLEKHLPSLDILYMTRIQRERFDDADEYERLKNSYILTAAMVKKGKASLRVMHPLPRVNEITTDVDDLPQAAYFRQVENGLFMRMAILKHTIKNYEKAYGHAAA